MPLGMVALNQGALNTLGRAILEISEGKHHTRNSKKSQNARFNIEWF